MVSANVQILSWASAGKKDWLQILFNYNDSNRISCVNEINEISNYDMTHCLRVTHVCIREKFPRAFEYFRIRSAIATIRDISLEWHTMNRKWLKTVRGRDRLFMTGYQLRFAECTWNGLRYLMPRGDVWVRTAHKYAMSCDIFKRVMKRQSTVNEATVNR